MSSASDKRRTAGVMGGMGPDATVDFMAKVIAATDADIDQDHARLLVDHNPGVPSRQLALRGEGEDPGPVMAAMAKGLEEAGADFLVMPCNTAHAYADAILAAVSIPLISIVDETVAACRGYESVGLLAIEHCLSTDIYQQALSSAGIDFVLSDREGIDELLELVNAIKAGDLRPEIKVQMQRLATGLVKKGAQAIIAGCTEIPLVLNESMLEVPLVSSTDVLAEVTAAICSGERELT